MPSTPPILAEARAEFEELVEVIRPKLHRYCARMTGSVIDAEDVVQDALAKAYYLLPTTEVTHLDGWLFRIAHNKAIDYLRSAKSTPIEFVEEYHPQPEEAPALDNEEATTMAVSVYLQLSPMQRSCVILKDVIGYSIVEISDTLEASAGAIKAALHRGRANLRLLAADLHDNMPLPLDHPETRLLAEYVARFSARDFDGLRAMLAEDVRLDLVEKVKKQGVSHVGRYFSNYEALDDWVLTLGFVERRPAILVSGTSDPGRFDYIILLEWAGERVSSIRDYRYAPLVLLDADVEVADNG